MRIVDYRVGTRILSEVAVVVIPGLQSARLAVILAVVVCIGCEQTSHPRAAGVAAQQSKQTTPGLSRLQRIVILSEAAARRRATDVVNRQLSGRKFQLPTGEWEFSSLRPEIWVSVYYDYRRGRIVLRCGDSGGFEAHVSLAGDGADPRLEHVEARGTQQSPPEPIPTRPEPASSQQITILSEPAARQRATDVVNRQLSGRKFRLPAGEWEFSSLPADIWFSVLYDYHLRRIVLRCGGSGGVEARISMAADGADPRLEHAELAWD